MADKTKWTPGPWKWETASDNSRLRPERLLGQCPAFDGTDPIVDDGSAGGEYGATITPDSPNAHLIAAAPDLYEALKLLLSVSTNHDHIDTARAALKKARGEA